MGNVGFTKVVARFKTGMPSNARAVANASPPAPVAPGDYRAAPWVQPARAPRGEIVAANSACCGSPSVVHAGADIDAISHDPNLDYLGHLFKPGREMDRSWSARLRALHQKESSDERVPPYGFGW